MRNFIDGINPSIIEDPRERRDMTGVRETLREHSRALAKLIPKINNPDVLGVQATLERTDNLLEFTDPSATLRSRVTYEGVWDGPIATLAEVSLTDAAFEIHDDLDPTKIAKFQCSGLTTNTTETYIFPRTGSGAVSTLAVANSVTALGQPTFPGGTTIVQQLFITGVGGVCSITYGGAAAVDLSLPEVDGTAVLWSGAGLPSAGSLLVGTGASSAMSQLFIGSADHILTSDGAGPLWSSNSSVVDQPRTWLTSQTFTTLTTFDANAGPAIVIDIQAGPGAGTFGDGTGFMTITDASTGFKSEWQIRPAGLLADQVLQIPNGTGEIVLGGATQTLGNKALATSCTLISSTAGTGVSFVDTTTSSKRLRMVLSGATGNNNFVISSTSARTYTFPDASITMAGSAAALTSGRVPFATTGGILTDDADLTFATDTLTATKVVIPTSVQVGGGAVLSILDQGLYTPTLNNVANLGASTAYQCQWMRVGNMVTVSGKVDADATVAATLTQLGISLPVASNFGAEEDCGGTGVAPGGASQYAAIKADAANNRAEMIWLAGDITNQSFHFSFAYRVI